MQGTLAVEIDGETYLLENGQSKTVAPKLGHRFYNPSDLPIEFEVKIEPASRGFEEFLQIMYGLAADGKTNKKGIPKNLWVIGAISQLGETLPPHNHILHHLAFIFRWLGRQAEKKGFWRNSERTM